MTSEYLDHLRKIEQDKRDRRKNKIGQNVQPREYVMTVVYDELSWDLVIKELI